MPAAGDPGADASPRRLAFGPFVVDLKRGELTRDGRVVALRRKAYELLVTLASRPGELRSKDELIAAVWPGIVVGEDSLAQCVHELRAALGDAGAALVQTVPRRGYRFDAEVRVVAPDGGALTNGHLAQPPAAGTAAGLPASTSVATASPPVRKRHLGLGALLLVIVIGLATLAWQRTRPDGATAAPPLSIVLLPLEVLEPGETPGWLAEALTADLTAALGQLSGAFVISRETAATYRGRPTDPRRIATELGVRHVAQGTVRRDGNRLRLGLTLADGATGAQVWSQSFELDRGALAASIDDVVHQVARSLNVQMIRAEGRRVAPLDAAQVQADDLAMQGFAVYFRGLTRENLMEARRLFDAAVERDEQSLRGWGGVAIANGFLAAYRWVDDRGAAVARVAEARRRLQALDEHDAHTYFAQMWETALADDHEGLLLVASRMTERLPSYPHAHTFRAVALFNLGRFDECVAAAHQALRLGPRDPTVAQRKAQIAGCQFMAGDYRAAAASAREALLLNGQLPLAPLLRAAALARDGRPDEARAIVAEHLQRHPGARAADIGRILRSEQPAFAAGRARLIDSLRELGMP